MSELMSCPFCGGVESTRNPETGPCVAHIVDDDTMREAWAVICYSCEGQTGEWDSRDDAVTAWNRRPCDE
jgi:hypothetical protein